MKSKNFDFLRDRMPSEFRELAIAERELHAKADITRIRIRRVTESVALEMIRELAIARKSTDRPSLIDHIGWIRADDRLGPRYAIRLDQIRKECNSSAHEILGEADARYINDTIGLLDNLREVLKFWVQRTEPGFTLPEYEEPPRFTSPETDAELEQILKEHRDLHQAQAQKALDEQEMASVWTGDEKKVQERQVLTHNQVRQFIRSHDSSEHRGAFKRAFERTSGPSDESTEGTSLTQSQLFDAQEQLEEQKERAAEEQRQADARIARRVAQLEKQEEQILKQEEWSRVYPVDSWPDAPEFFGDRLRKGLPPFEPWLMSPMKIGEGAHGEVFRCYPSSGGVPVAVKIPRRSRDMSAVKRAWEWEVRSAKKLAFETARKPIEGVPRPLAISPPGCLGYVTYELIDGRTLREELRVSTIHPRRALYLIDRLQRTLRSLLDAEIRFTDLADRNVMIKRDGEPTLVDLAPCLPSEANPPEWTNETRFSGRVAEVRSGHYFMLGNLFLKMIGAGGRRPSGVQGSLGSFDVFLESSSGPSPAMLKERQRAAILEKCEGIVGFDTKGLAGLMEDCIFNPEVRRRMKPDDFVAAIRSLYDPSGIMETISSNS